MISPITVLRSVAISGLVGASFAIADAAAAISVPSQELSATPQAELLAQAEETIVGIAAGNENFSTLVTALEAADLVDALSGDGPFTVFAPTNAAFAALPDATLEALLEPENQDLLTEILTYHVVPEELGADGVAVRSSVETLNGDDVNIDVVDGEVMVNQADVIMADVEASNGVIHVIDAVLVPDGVVEELTARMEDAETEMVETEVVETEVVETEVVETTPATTTTTPATTTTTEEATTISEPVRGLW
jgi:uncharacterized surface protein with fasciclin (FAS1) repeats